MRDKLGFKQNDDVNQLLYRGGCTMAYQPIQELQTGKVYGYEALLRGSNGTPLPQPEALFSNRGYLSDELLLRLDVSCIGSALRGGRDLAADHRLFINLHASTLQHLSSNFGAFEGLLRELQIDPRHIVLEISERTDLVFAVDVEKNLREFVDVGIEVAIDDIGASFNWLHHMLNTKPAFLKVDKVFVADIDTSRRKQALVRSLHLMSQAMGLRLIAEGIENSAQLQSLSTMGIAFAQGYWFGHPAPAEEWMGGKKACMQ
jgi:EAL domain-containing protein (putative c-di-GMP-specific phosphodiesterase class I)